MISCASKIPPIHDFKNDNVKVKDTITSSGFIIYNKKRGETKFFKMEKVIISDSLKFFTKLDNTKGDYIFIDPYDIRRSIKNYKLCSDTIKSSRYIKQKGIVKDLEILYTEKESFILLEGSKNKYISFLCW
jgi:hypothetical protein